MKSTEGRNAMELDLTKLKSARGAACLTQEELAKLAGVGRSTVANLERGGTNNVTVDKLVKLCNALEIDFSFFTTKV